MSIKDIYKHLSPENKGAFWSVTTNALLVIVTCWLGFSVQHIINDSEQAESEKVARHQIVDRFMPLYEELFDSCSNVVFKTCYKALDTPKTHGTALLVSFMSDEKNWANIEYTARKIMEISTQIAPYADKDTHDFLLRNNGLMLIGCHLFEALNDTVVLDSINFVEKYSDKYLDKVISNTVHLNEDLSTTYGKCYNLYKLVIENRNQINSDKDMMNLLNHFCMIPMYDNMKHIIKEISPQEASKPLLRWANMLRYLIAALIIGVILFGGIITKFLDRNSMKPNPRMSQTDLEKINKELTSHRLLEQNFNNSTEAIKNYQQEIKSLESKIQELETANKSLNEQIQHSEENKE